MDFLMSNLGEKLKAERNRRGLSQKDVARGIGTSGSYISQLENGERKPTLENYLKVISFFGVEFSYFLDTNIDELEIVGREIKALREKKNWSIGELRDASGVDFFRIGRAESGEIALTDEELLKIAEALEVTTDYFSSRYDYNMSKIQAAANMLGLDDNQISLLVNYIDDCMQKNKSTQ